jgi:hypothetical protein
MQNDNLTDDSSDSENSDSDDEEGKLEEICFNFEKLFTVNLNFSPQRSLQKCFST